MSLGHLKSLGCSSVVARWYHSGLLRGRGPKKFVKKVTRNDVGVITNEFGPFKITLWYHSGLLRGRGQGP
jgi:hypothetical protein